MSLVARHLEANGIPTVVIGVAKDIVEHCAVPRMLFVDFPLGNPCGEPHQVEMQQAILEKGLWLLENAPAPQTTLEAGYTWSKGEQWKQTVFTQAQPWLQGKGYDQWIQKKALYRQLRAEGKV